MSDKCPKCGAEKDPNHAYYICGTWMGAPRESSRGCLRRQLAAANAKISEMARLAEDTRLNVEAITGVGGWRPIETAPKDRSLLCYGVVAGEVSGIHDHGSVEVAYYQPGGDFPDFDWVTVHGDAYAVWMKPTHWMPLPQPPKEADDDDA